MRAILLHIFRQGCQATQRAMHLLGRSLEQSPAAHREQGVANERQPIEHESDVLKGNPLNTVTLRRQLADAAVAGGGYILNQ